MNQNADTSTEAIYRTNSGQDEQIPALTGLRAVAALLIVVLHSWNGVHAANCLPLERLLRPALALWCGVDLFFVLSGFLLTGKLLRSVGDKKYLRNFYAARCFRIMPLYYLVLLTALFIGFCTRSLNVGDIYSFFGMMFFMTNFLPFVWNLSQHIGIVPMQHFWSLALEEHFYLLWPHAVKFLEARKLMNFCAIIMVCELVVRSLAVWQKVSLDAIYELSFFRFDSIAAGAIVACLYQLTKNSQRALRTSHFVLIPFLCGTFLMTAITHLFKANPFVETVGYSILAITFASVIADIVFSRGRSLIGRFCSNPVLLFFGKRSYAIYLIHLPLITLVNRLLVTFGLNTNPALVLILGLVLPLVMTIVLSMMAWHLIEKPCQKLKVKYSC